MNIFLGNPPENIKQWIIEHYTPPTPPASGPLCFTAEQDGSSVSLVYQNNYGPITDPTPPNLQYSLNDTEHWTEYEINQIIPLAKDAKVFFKANGQNKRISAPPTMGPPLIYRFEMKGKIAASGNIQYLLDDTGSRTDVPSNCYSTMFSGCSNLTQAPALPATTLAINCYNGMFSGCSKLTQAPALPATTLADSCYSSMFSGCSKLTAAPVLLATTLADSCYFYMLEDCSSLTQAPALPATTLASSCYKYMFKSCTSLTQAPALPATTIADYCYDSMFYGCTSLTQAPTIKTYTPNLYAFGYMLCMFVYNTNEWGQLTTCTWNDLTLVEVESMVLSENIFGLDNPGASVRISITCKDGSGTAYYDSGKYSWVFEH